MEAGSASYRCTFGGKTECCGLNCTDMTWRQKIHQTNKRRLLYVISSIPNLMLVSGCSSTVLRTLNSSLFDHGIQYPFCFDVFSLLQIKHQRNGSVFWRIHFFSVVNFAGMAIWTNHWLHSLLNCSDYLSSARFRKFR